MHELWEDGLIEHVYHKCPKPCPYGYDGCMWCDKGHTMCDVCGAFEGQLLASCPGYLLNEETLDACYHGNVYDFVLLKRWKEAGYNVRKKSWR